MEKIHRSKLLNAPYNPRVLSDKAREKLKASIAQFGIVAPPTWNKRSGNLVGGHQRLSVMDSLQKSKNYCLTVAVVDVDEKREKELNILLNNSAAMGDYDLEKLESVLKECDAEMAGFDKADIMQMFGDDFLKQDAGAIAELSEQVREARERYAKIQEKVTDKRDNADFYCVLVFRDNGEVQQFADKLKLTMNKWIDGNYVMARLKESNERKE